MSNAFMPTLRRKLASDPYGVSDIGSHDLLRDESDELLFANPGGVFSPNMQSGPTDEAGHYEPNRSRSNAPYAPTLLREGELAKQAGMPANPYSARLTELGGQLQSAYAAPHAGAF